MTNSLNLPTNKRSGECLEISQSEISALIYKIIKSVKNAEQRSLLGQRLIHARRTLRDFTTVLTAENYAREQTQNSSGVLSARKHTDTILEKSNANKQNSKERKEQSNVLLSWHIATKRGRKRNFLAVFCVV